MRTFKLLLFAATSLLTLGLTPPVSRAQTVPGSPTESTAGDAGSGTIAPNGVSSLTGVPPDTGAKGEATGSPLTWQAVSTGAVPSDGEDVTSVDGVNHDYFKLTVTPSLFTGTGKVITVTISWLNPATDYDLYVHGGAENGPVIGSSATGAPGTMERVAIDPTANIDPNTGSAYTVYYLNVVYFTVPDAELPASTKTPYTGTAVITSALVTTLGTYTHGTTPITFSPNTPCKSPTASQQGEPASRIDAQGHYYISGIEGVPAGVDLWYFDLNPSSPTYDPLMTTPQYRGMPDSLTSNPSPLTPGTLPKFNAGGVGGGDVDVAVGFGNYTGPVDTGSGEGAVTAPTTPAPALAMSSLTAANVTVFRSLDLGQTFTKNVAGNIAGGVPVNDRQWMQFIGNNDVYLEYRNFGAGVAFIQQSTDGGLTYNQPAVVGTIPQTGYIDVDQHDGTVYVGGNDGSVSVGKPTSVGGLISALTTFNKYQATASTTPANIFFCVRVAQNDVGATVDALTHAEKKQLRKARKKARHETAAETGTAQTYTNNTVYAVYSDGKNIFLVYSLDQAQTWSNPVQVNDPNDARTKTNLLPWFAPGPMPGTVGIVWYATDAAVNDDTSKWRVYYAYGTNVNSTTVTPNFDVAQASDHSNHAANISLNGLSVTGQSPNRNLIDYFQIQFDPKGAAVIGYTDDHNDFQGFTYVTRQQTGTSALTGNALAAATPGASLAAETATQPAQPGPNGEQVTDYSQDQDSALLAVTPTNSPIDIQSIKYQSQDVGAGPVIQASMVVSQLTPIPVDSTWMMFFTANAPESGTLAGPATSQYSTGLSDRGDQFFIEAVTAASGATTYNWGSVVRNFDGSTTDTVQGTADSGSFDRATRTVSVRISASTLNAFLDSEKATNGADPVNSARYTHIASGSVLCGLRGEAFEENTSGGTAVTDATRGGTEYKVP